MLGLLSFIARNFAAGTTLVTDDSDAKLYLALLRCVIIMYNNIGICKNVAHSIFTYQEFIHILERGQCLKELR